MCTVGSTKDNGATRISALEKSAAPYNPHPEARRFSSSLYVPGTFLLLELRASVYECLLRLFKSLSLLSGFQSYPNGIPADFSQPEFVGTPLPGSGAQSWEAQCGVKIPCSLVGPSHPRYPS